MTQITIATNDTNGSSASHAIHRSVVHKIVTELLNLVIEQGQHIYSSPSDIGLEDQPGPSALSRLLEIITGFHTGSFDLGGRHKPRYLSILLAWKTFLEYSDVWKDAYNFERTSHYKLIHSLYVPSSNPWDGGLNFLSLPDSVTKTKFIDVINHHKTPIFQTLLLDHLPPELCHRIMGFLPSDDARYFGYTRHFLREISLQYIRYEEWLILDPKFAQEGIVREGLDLDASPKFITELTLDARRRFQERADFIYRSPNIAKNLEILHISGCWRIPLLEIVLVNTHERCELYYQPVFESILAVLSQAKGITSVGMTNFKIPLAVVEAILSLPLLHTLEFHTCQVTFDCMTMKNPTVANLSLEVNSLGIWNVLSGLPNIRVLHVQGQPTSFIPSPSSNIPNPFKTLERFALYDLDPSVVPEFCAWIREANVGQLSRLTHVKLQTDYTTGLSVAQLLNLIQVLRGPSLEVLALDGVDFAEAVLFEWLAKAFPSLRSLVVIYLRSVEWPSLLLDYAKALSEFQHLEYFRWDRWEDPDFTAAVPLILEGYPDTSSLTKSAGDDDNDYGDLYENPRLTAKLIAAYCPALAYIFFDDNNIGYQTHRSAAGTVTLSKVDSVEQVYSDRVAYANPPKGSGTWNL